MVATGGVVLAALYLLWAYQQAFHHEPDEATAKVRDLSWREVVVVAPLVALIVVLGVYPKPVLDRITPSVTRLVQHVETSTGTHQPAVANPGPARPPRRPWHGTPVRGGCDDPHRLGLWPHALPKIAYLSILPVLVMLGGAVAVLAASSVLRRRMDATAATVMAVMTTLAALSLSLVQWFDVATTRCARLDRLGRGGGRLQLPGGRAGHLRGVALRAGRSTGGCAGSRATGPEFQALMLLSASGAMIMGEANDLIVVFLGLEILSIALYVLAAMNARAAESGEAALKYFILGSFSSAVFLYGIALVYGATGSTNLPQIADYLARNVLLHNGLLLAGMALLLVGFGFKVAAVPFHLWTPDVYQGSPSPATGFMAAVAKAGGFAALLRVFVSSFGTAAQRLAAGGMGAGGDHPAARGGGGPGPARHQADARLLVDQPRRLRAPRACRWPRLKAAGV